MLEPSALISNCGNEKYITNAVTGYIPSLLCLKVALNCFIVTFSLVANCFPCSFSNFSKPGKFRDLKLASITEKKWATMNLLHSMIIGPGLWSMVSLFNEHSFYKVVSWWYCNCPWNRWSKGKGFFWDPLVSDWKFETSVLYRPTTYLGTNFVTEKSTISSAA